MCGKEKTYTIYTYCPSIWTNNLPLSESTTLTTKTTKKANSITVKDLEIELINKLLTTAGTEYWLASRSVGSHGNHTAVFGLVYRDYGFNVR